MEEFDFSQIEGFDWDSGNTDKNREKHNVAIGEAEEIFFNSSLMIARDLNHSQREERFAALGVTNSGRKLFAIFTTRNNKIRIISVRDMSRKERKFYEDNEKEDT